MKKNSFIYCFLLCSHVMFSQVKETVVNHILNNTSAKNSYAILFKNHDGRINFVWSNDLLDYYKSKSHNKANAIAIIKRKLLADDTFNITSNSKMSVGFIDSIKLKQVSRDANRGLHFFINKYFKENQLNSNYSGFVREISYCLWKKNTYIFVGLDNGSLPSIGVKGNKVITNPQKVNGIVERNNTAEVEFYFPKYDYYVSTKSSDTSLLYLKFNSKRTDVQRLSPKLYSGEYEYVKFNIDKIARLITVELYNGMKIFQAKEVYKYSNEQKQQEEINFHSLTSSTKTIKHKVIIPVQLNK